MKRQDRVRALIFAVALAAGTSAKADVLVFNGSMSGLAVSGPDASCAPLPFRGTISPSTTIGTSSLGDFTYSHNICLSGPNGPSGGSFTIDFGGDSFLGTLAGGATPSSVVGIANVAWTFTILGGTGRFLGATGTFVGAGTTDARVRPAIANFGFNGTINAPAVPEPATWAMMLLGFGLVGGRLRSRRSTNKFVTQIA